MHGQANIRSSNSGSSNRKNSRSTRPCEIFRNMVGFDNEGLAVSSWHLAVGSWKLEVGSWKLAVGIWQLVVGSWQLAFGSWKLAVGIWHLAVCSWQLAVGTSANPKAGRPSPVAYAIRNVQCSLVGLMPGEWPNLDGERRSRFVPRGKTRLCNF